MILTVRRIAGLGVRPLSSSALPLLAPPPSVRTARPAPPPPLSAATWFSLRAGLRSALVTLGISRPTRVQEAAIPQALAGAHVLIASATGEGKTLAFLLPLAHRLKEAEVQRGVVARAGRPRAIVVSPTRELALQTARVAKALAHVEKFSVSTLVGGMDEREQRTRILARPTDVLIATPGRLAAATRDGWLSLADVRVVALDEVDTLLDAHRVYSRNSNAAALRGGAEVRLVGIMGR